MVRGPARLAADAADPYAPKRDEEKLRRSPSPSAAAAADEPRVAYSRSDCAIKCSRKDSRDAPPRSCCGCCCCPLAAVVNRADVLGEDVNAAGPPAGAPLMSGECGWRASDDGADTGGARDDEDDAPLALLLPAR